MGRYLFSRSFAAAFSCAAVMLCLCSLFCEAASGGEYQGVLINSVPHVKAKADFAGEACAEMALRRIGAELDQDFVFDQSGVDPAFGRGCNVGELKLALERIGFVVGQVWYALSPDTPRADLDLHFAALHADLSAGVPNIVHMRKSEKDDTQHFRLVLGYDDHKDEIIYHEPAEKNGSLQRMTRESLLKLWPIRQGDTFTIARLAMNADADDLNYVGPTEAISDADYAQHVRALKAGLPEDFHVFVQKPFVIVGNEMEGTVRKYANETVKWAVDRLKLMYFEKDPEQIVTIWLLKDEKSYNAFIEKFYKHKPVTKFGYYSPGHRAIFANMSYGTGTLVHEIVHPFMLANFPKCPPWFNEGLASLYEQSNDRDGRMLAQTNQRLKLMHKAIMAKKMPPIESLTNTDRQDFYAGPNRLLYYAQARYLCYYLEKNELLGAFYHEFRANAEEDPTGYKTLKKVLGDDGEDMGKFQRKWEYSLLLLRY